MPFTKAIETLCDAMEQPAGRALKPVANINLLFDENSGRYMMVSTTAVPYVNGSHMTVSTTTVPTDIVRWVSNIIADFDRRHED